MEVVYSLFVMVIQARILRNRMYTQEDCDKWLNDDLKAVKRYVDPLIKVNINTLTQAALYSFAYNVGG